jgi:hypothetical protein
MRKNKIKKTGMSINGNLMGPGSMVQKYER